LYCNYIYYSMSNGRFAINIHILTALALAGDEWYTSEYLAESININPVLIRKELSNLRKHGFVTSREGKHGGCSLAKPAYQIKFSEIYKAVYGSTVLGHYKNEPNQKCPVGRQIQEHLTNLYNEAEFALLEKLSSTTLSDFAEKFAH
jgi:Rrf2 family protein